jgi:hypothetical protein
LLASILIAIMAFLICQKFWTLQAGHTVVLLVTAKAVLLFGILLVMYQIVEMFLGIWGGTQRSDSAGSRSILNLETMFPGIQLIFIGAFLSAVAAWVARTDMVPKP